MAASGSSSLKTSKSPPKPLEKVSGKAAAASASKAPSNPPLKPPLKPHDKGQAKAALPDATLLNDETPAAEAASPSGWAAWLPTGRKRWMVAAAAGGGVTAMVAAAAFAAVHFRAPPPAPPVTAISGPARAVDGATLTVAGRTVRLEAIDAPPASLVCRDGAWKYRCGDSARRALDDAIDGAPVECVHLRPDSRGQVVALCRSDSGLDLAAIQVESGWAVNDIATSSRYVAEQMRAEQSRSGLWRNDFAHPELWRDAASARR